MVLLRKTSVFAARHLPAHLYLAARNLRLLQANSSINEAMGTNKKTLTTEQALQKLRHYCGYQERCHSEVKEKLYKLGVFKNEHDAIISTLIEEDYLNEERFAIAFAGGKFRMKQWGRIKIKYELKQKQVSEYSIKKALQQIQENEYREGLKKLADEKYAALKNEQHLLRKKKTIDYLLQRGFEMELVRGMVGEE
jgi:regulatory protein